MKNLLRVACLLGAALSTHIGWAQTRAEFSELLQKGDTLGMKALIQNWEKKDAKDPELFVAKFNYYFNQGRHSGIAIEPYRRSNESMEMKDSTGTSFYLNDVITYDGPTIKYALGFLDQGLALYPDRLDMRCGKCKTYMQVNRYGDFLIEVDKILSRSLTNKNAWLWTENASRPDGEKGLLSVMHEYYADMYYAEQDSLVDYMQKHAANVLKYYPDHIESISDLSITYMMRGQWDKALTTLQRAEPLAPADPVIMGNIANCYVHLEDKKNAIKYYKLVIKYSPAEEQGYAKQKIAELEGK